MAFLTWAYALISVFVVSIISFVGIFTLLIKEERLKKLLVFLVSFSAGALLGDAFIHLIPQVAEDTGFTPMVSLVVLAGILMFFVLEKMICWRHCHVPTSKNHPHPLAFMNLLGDGFHNFLDGMIIAGSYMIDIKLGFITTIAVVLHEIPQEMGELGVLIHAGIEKSKALLFNFISALAAVLGAVITLTIGNSSLAFTQLLTPFTIGGFIYIASADLIPELHKETGIRKSIFQLIGIISGILVMLSMLIIE